MNWTALVLAGLLMACSTGIQKTAEIPEKSDLEQKAAEYASFTLTTDLSVLTNLQQLDLTDDAVEASDIETMANLNALEALYLYGTQITQAEIDRLEALIPDCAIEY